MEPTGQPIRTVPIKLDTEHELFLISKHWLLCFEIVRRIILLSVGIWITRVLFLYCLFNPGTNTIVTTFFCVISMACFISVGLPADKLAKISFTN